MNFLRIFQHLLPNGKAWRITADKQLRQFFDGLKSIGDDLKVFTDSAYNDLFPATTRELDAWDLQFGLKNVDITDQQRRDRIDAAWKALGGQSPRYIQDTLQDNGFNVFVHDWWVPGTEPGPGVKQCVTPRDPRLVLREEFNGITIFVVECGEPLAECGEPTAQAGDTITLRGYPLVNKVFESVPLFFVLCGEVEAECGEPNALCGNFLNYIEINKNYFVPDDPNKWHYFFYIGGEIFGELAEVENKRRNEFEDLCLKICPTQLWLGILVEYL